MSAIDTTDERTHLRVIPNPNHNGHGAPPHDADAEAYVLGAALRGADVLEQLDPADFYRPAHEALWELLRRLHGQGVPLEPTAVLGPALADPIVARAAGGPSSVGPFLHDLTAACHTPANADYYAQRVRLLARQRHAIAATRTALERISATTTDDVELSLAVGDALDALDAAARIGTSTGRGGGTWAAVDLTNALDGKDTDLPPTICARTDGACLLYPASVHTLSGEPGSGKTWVALHAVTEQLAAERDVLYLDFEDRPGRVVTRLLDMGAHPDHIAAHLRYIRPVEPIDTVPGARAALDAAAAGVALAVVDGVTEAMSLHGWNPDNGPDVAAFYAALPRRIADLGAAVLLIDHVVKDSEKQGRWATGSQHKLAGIDGAAYLTRIVDRFGRGQRGRSRITVSKDRPGHVEASAVGLTVAELHLDATDPDALRYELATPSRSVDAEGHFRPTGLMEKVSRFLEASPGVTANTVKDARLGKTTYVLDALRQLIADGYVQVVDGPNRATFHTSVRPFREDEG